MPDARNSSPHLLLSAVFAALKTILKLIIASETFKTLMAAHPDWLCALVADVGKWLIKKHRGAKRSTSMMKTYLNKNSTLFADTNS